MYSRLAPDFLRASEDDLKTFSEIHSQFIGNSFWDVFYSISEAMMTRPANIPGTLEYARDPSPESDLSSSSNEDKDEEISRNLMNGILRVIFSHAGYSPIESQGFKYRVEPCASYHLRRYVADNDRNMRSQMMRIPLGTSSRKLQKMMEVSPLPVKDSTPAQVDMALYQYLLQPPRSRVHTVPGQMASCRWYPTRRRRIIIFPGYFGTRSGGAFGPSNGALCTVGGMEGSRGLYPHHPRNPSQAGCCTLQRKIPFACE